uniref:1,4-alpha-glucan branching enzyme GlgB n=1 Tax=Magnetococcus massalia (strain MO-1) TaxID=451514 RepID=A0A1S7LDG1_MAGMO|nr:GH13 : 1,4-alpha-glucan branching enzyme (modular protein) [Candidatus Magnetococcus massalia]
MEFIAENLEGTPNLCGSEPLIARAVESGQAHARFLDDSDLHMPAMRAASGIILHMHQPMIPAEQGRTLQQAGLISHLKHMYDNPHIGDNHNAPIFHWCYKRMAEFVSQLRHEGRSPRVMLDYSGALLHGLRSSGMGDIIDALKGVTCNPSFRRNVEWLGSSWGHAPMDAISPRDFERQVRAWQHTFASLFGTEALGWVRGFSPANLSLPNHPDHAYAVISTLRECGYQWIVLPEEAVADPSSGEHPRSVHLPHRLVARNSAGDEVEILTMLISPGNRHLQVGQLQPYYESLQLGRKQLGDKQVPPMALQWGPGEEGGVMMNEFPAKYREVVNSASGSETPLMNVSEYLEHLFALGVAWEALPVVQPAHQKAVWANFKPPARGDKAAALEKVISTLRSDDPHFAMNSPRMTDDGGWVKAQGERLSTADHLSIHYHHVVDGEATGEEPRVNHALRHLLLAQDSQLQSGTLASFGEELCRRGHEILNHDFAEGAGQPQSQPAADAVAKTATAPKAKPATKSKRDPAKKVANSPAKRAAKRASLATPAPAPKPVDPLVPLHAKLHTDPFAVLGRFFDPKDATQILIRVHLPDAQKVKVWEVGEAMTRLEGSDFFEWRGAAEGVPSHYHLWVQDRAGHEQLSYDPYSFGPQLLDFDLHLFNEGSHRQAWRFLGAHETEVEGIAGVRFAVWAPNAQRVSVVGDFNQWHGLRYPMHPRSSAGIWELFIPGIVAGTLYKYEIQSRDGGPSFLKVDPYGRSFELRPKNASIVAPAPAHDWQDGAWMEARKHFDWQRQPISVYEVHLGSWKRGSEGQLLSYREMADELVPYVLEMGFTHVEFMPITEHPFDPSWGYQATGYFAPTSRFGSPDDLRYLVDVLHQNSIGVILDWVPAHFPKDAHALARFDGTALYEHEDPRLGEHMDWSTLIFNFGRHEVKSFLISSAIYWLTEFHIDGLRVDAVASMLYLDYSREEWIPNRYGGRENLEAIAFLRDLNRSAHQEVSGALIFAEESTAWPMVTKPGEVGGLGFNMKWNMGWMNDTLSYISEESVHKKYHHEQWTFSLVYAFNENFILPFSHDEVVHGKGSMLGKMPGDEWQRFANLRALYGYMFTHPGKKLLFMGTEFAQSNEWDSSVPLSWSLLQYGPHQGVQRVVRDLNNLYRNHSALHGHDFDEGGFEWIETQDGANAILIYARKSEAGHLVVLINMTPIPHEAYRVGVLGGGAYREIFNTDSEFYGGSNVGNGGADLAVEDKGWMGREQSILLRVPPLAMIVLQPVAEMGDNQTKAVVKRATTAVTKQPAAGVPAKAKTGKKKPAPRKAAPKKTT